MTRFLMSLDESVDLVDMRFCTQSRATCSCARPRLPRSRRWLRGGGLLGVRGPAIAVIGTRHGEKLYETLLSREEMPRAEDHGDYFRVPLDARSLHYELFFDEGEPRGAERRRLHLAQHRAARREQPWHAAARCPRSRLLVGAAA